MRRLAMVMIWIAAMSWVEGAAHGSISVSTLPGGTATSFPAGCMLAFMGGFMTLLSST